MLVLTSFFLKVRCSRIQRQSTSAFHHLHEWQEYYWPWQAAKLFHTVPLTAEWIYFSCTLVQKVGQSVSIRNENISESSYFFEAIVSSGAAGGKSQETSGSISKAQTATQTWQREPSACTNTTSRSDRAKLPWAAAAPPGLSSLSFTTSCHSPPVLFAIVISCVSNISFGVKDPPPALLRMQARPLPLITSLLVTISHTWEDGKVAGGRQWCRALGRPSYQPAGRAADPASIHLPLSPLCTVENVAPFSAYCHQAEKSTV